MDAPRKLNAQEEFEALEEAGKALAAVGDTGRPTRKRSSRSVSRPENGGFDEPASKRVKKESKGESSVVGSVPPAAVAGPSSVVGAPLSAARAATTTNTTTKKRASGPRKKKAVSFADAPPILSPHPVAAGASGPIDNPIDIEGPPSPALSLSPPPPEMNAAPPPKTVQEWEELLGFVHPHKPTLEKNAHKMMEGKKTAVWGFVKEEVVEEKEPMYEVGEVKRTWVEPPVVVDKYVRGPVNADYHLEWKENDSFKRPSQSTHNLNTTAAAPGPHAWYDFSDKFWAGDVGRSISVVHVEMGGERVVSKKLKKAEGWGWGHSGENHWG